MANKYASAIIEAEGQIKSLTEKLGKLHQSILDNAKEFNNIFKGGGADLKVVKAQIELVNKQMALLTKQNKSAISTERDLQAKTRTRIALIKEEEATLKKNITVKKEQERQTKLQAQALEKEQRETAKQTARNTELSRAYVKLVNEQKKAKKVLQDLIVTQGKGSRETKKAQKEYDKLTAKVNQANKATSNFSKTGLGSMARGFKNLLGAFGVIGGIQIFANAVKDTFKRVREFDKSMQNLAGVFRTTREALKPLEKDIISVAGQSVKTSREVADLAESLATLGKTPEQIRKLLKPVVDLGIGLEATGEDAGEFLIQMLNAFGASDDEAMKYADTIATIRTSTTLDFQKMRDSFQYIAPISRLLGKDLAYTGSVVGILADNGLKAQQAGRVLGTSLQKLASQGLSLDDALNQINEATSKGVKEVELLAMANKLLGAEGAKIGIVLAENKTLIDENAQSIRDNGGALKDLVEQQMESLDAKLLVLDASWEELILRIENGQGVFSNAFKSIIIGATDFLNVLSDINQVTEIIGETRDYNLSDLFILPKGIYKAYSDMTRLRDATKEYQAQLKEFESIDLTDLNEVTSLIDIWTEMREEVKDNEGAVKSLDYFLNKLKETERSIYEDARNADDERRKNEKDKRNGLSKEGLVLESLRKKLKELSDQKKSLGSVSELQNKDYLTWQELTKEINKTKSAIEELIGKKKKLKDDPQDRKRAKALELPKTKGIDTLTFNYLGKTKSELKDILKMEEIRLMMMYASDPLWDNQYNRIESIKILLDDLPDDKIIISEDNSKNVKDLLNKLKKLEATKDIINEVTDTFSEMFDIDMSKFDFLFDEAKNTVEDWAKLSKELIGSVLDASLQRYQIELQTAQRNRDLTLNNELATEEAKENARIKFREEERRINTERAKQERENALIKIAVDTAVAVASIWAQVPKFDFGVSAGILTAATIALGAAQAGIVASQPLPQFFDGIENSTYQGWATKDEKGAEIQLDKHGNIKDLGQNKGSKYTYVERGDTIIPAMQTKSILENFDIDNMQRIVFDMNMFSNGELLKKTEVDNSLLREVGGLRKDIDTMGRRIEKIASRPISVNNKVELKDNRAY